MRYTIQEIAQVLGIEPSELRDKNAEVSQLLTDSRSLTYPAETLFFALTTQNDDGHRYVKHLYNKGVRNFVIEYSGNIDIQAMREANFLRVTSTLDAMQAIATYHRRRFDIPIIGITGSRGKTITRRLGCHCRCGTSTTTPTWLLLKQESPRLARWRACKR